MGCEGKGKVDKVINLAPGMGFETSMHASLQDLGLQWGGLHSAAKLINDWAPDAGFGRLNELGATPRTSCKLAFPDLATDFVKRNFPAYRKGCEDLVFFETFKRGIPHFYCSTGSGCKQCESDVAICRAIFCKHNHRMNDHWMEGIFEQLKGNASPCLLVPGAAHLYGARGLVSLLRKEGWTVNHYEGIKWPQ